MNHKNQTSSKTAGSPPPPFAIPELLDRCMGNPAIATLLLDKFEKQLKNDIPEIERQVAAKDAGQIARTAHALKGAAGAVASPALRDFAAALETHAKASRLDAIAQELSSLRSEVERCLAYLPTARGTLKQGIPGDTAGTEDKQ